MNQEDYIPLFNAIRDGDIAAVESFLQTPGVDVDFLSVRGGSNYSPLNTAIRRNQKDIVEDFLAHGAAVNGPVGVSSTPLQQACSSSNESEDIINLLLEKGADIEATTADVRIAINSSLSYK
jgi:ankyrin repeat protein